MKRLIPIVLLLLLSAPACDDNNLAKVSKSMLVVAETVGKIQADAIAWHDAGLTSEETTRGILLVCVRVNTAGLQVDEILRSLERLDELSARNLISLLEPVSQALDPGKLAVLANISDPAIKQQLTGYLLLVRSSIGTAMLILASVG